MGQNLDKILLSIDRLTRSEVEGLAARVDARAKLLASIALLVAMLSVPLEQIGRIALWSVPIVMAALVCGVNYLRVAKFSLVVLPFVAFVGLFNVIYDREPRWVVAGIIVTQGWVMALSMMLRAMLSVQIIVLLMRTTGVYALCHAMRRLRVPELFVVQLLFLFRFLSLMISELQAMTRAADARSAGIKRYPIGLWGRLVAELLLRSVRRAKAIERAMAARMWSGGAILFENKMQWRMVDTMFLLLTLVVAVGLRIVKF